MAKVLFLNPYYYPGFRSGGPQRTLMNIADAFGEQQEIYILTQNCDFGSSDSYDVETHKWIRVGNANVMYLPPKEYNILSIKKYSKDFEKVYACGLFCGCTINALLLHKLNPSQKLYVAPMGVFSEAAIASKAPKKRSFLFVFKHCGFFKNIVWSFTSKMEILDAKKVLGDAAIQEYIIAEDLPRMIDFETQLRRARSQDIHPGEPLKIVFLSRISPQKNLDFCAEILREIKDIDIYFDIYGTIEDKSYWDKCSGFLDQLPHNIHYRYCGEVTPENVIDTFSKYDVFLFPTKGENFGHVIYEALAAGCVPIISDRTPWQDLEEAKCGYVLPLVEPNAFRKAIQSLAVRKAEIKEMKINAVEYTREKRSRAIKESGYMQVFL